MKSRLNKLKKDTFFELLDLAGRVFIVVGYSDDVRIGSRGFLEGEKETGLVLVLNRRMKFKWDDDVLECRLVFGTEPHDCIIPEEHILAVHSPEMNTQLVVAPMSPESASRDGEGGGEPASQQDEGNVVEVDFKKKRR